MIGGFERLHQKTTTSFWVVLVVLFKGQWNNSALKFTINFINKSSFTMKENTESVENVFLTLFLYTIFLTTN